jgi:hypothetical protein
LVHLIDMSDWCRINWILKLLIEYVLRTSDLILWLISYIIIIILTWLIIIEVLAITAIECLACVTLIYWIILLSIILLISLTWHVIILFLLGRIYCSIKIVLLLNIFWIDLKRWCFILKKWIRWHRFIGCIVETIINTDTVLTISLCFTLRIEFKFSICINILFLIIDWYLSVFIIKFLILLSIKFLILIIICFCICIVNYISLLLFINNFSLRILFFLILAVNIIRHLV